MKFNVFVLIQFDELFIHSRLSPSSISVESFVEHFTANEESVG